MRRLTIRGRAALEAAARQSGATLISRRGAADAYLTWRGRSVAVEVVAARLRAGSGLPRLRFDKAVIRLLRDLREAACDSVPDGWTVAVTVTAPIRVPGKTADALSPVLGRIASSGTARRSLHVHGNRIRLQSFRSGRSGAKFIGFVHNPDTDPAPLFDAAKVLLARRPRAGSRGRRWLVIVNDRGLSVLDAYRQVGAQLGEPTPFERIIEVGPGGRVRVLPA